MKLIALSDELAGTENRIAIARQDYNTIATKYNTKRRKFPTTIIASIFNFEESHFIRLMKVLQKYLKLILLNRNEEILLKLNNFILFLS